MPLLRVTQTSSCRSQTAMSHQDKFPFVTETSRYWMRSTSCRFLWRYRPSCDGVGEGGTARRLEQFQALRDNKSSASPVLMNTLVGQSARALAVVLIARLGRTLQAPRPGLVLPRSRLDMGNANAWPAGCAR